MLQLLMLYARLFMPFAVTTNYSVREKGDDVL
jgi:hypothetical protein